MARPIFSAAGVRFGSLAPTDNTQMPEQKRRLILLTGIPGTGKTYYGNAFEHRFGFTHYNLEDAGTLSRLSSNPSKFIEQILQEQRDIVVTWGFFPDGQQTEVVKQFKSNGFKLVWFDGNRSAALRAFNERGTVPEELFDAQIQRIDESKVVQAIEPFIINTFDKNEKFKNPATILGEIEKC